MTTQEDVDKQETLPANDPITSQTYAMSEQSIQPLLAYRI